MNTQVCDSPASFHGTPQIAAATGSAWRDAVDTLVQYWHARHVRARQARANDAMVEVGAHLLKDIGAPDWMVAEASTRQDGRDLRLIDLYRS